MSRERKKSGHALLDQLDLPAAEKSLEAESEDRSLDEYVRRSEARDGKSKDDGIASSSPKS